MKYPVLQRILSVLFAVFIVFALLITSIEAVVYWTPDWFEREYTKYNVLDEVRGEMSMESALEVTDEMMQYLRGNRDDLVVMTEIDGKTVEFFSDREKAHLADCRVLFIGGLRLRTFALVLSVLIAVALYALNRSGRKTAEVIAGTFAPASGVMMGIFVVIGLLLSRNFDRYFVIFHHIFFDNDLWLLDPNQDNLINLLPEDFFYDTAFRILIIFFASVLILCGLSIVLHRKMKRSSYNERHK